MKRVAKELLEIERKASIGNLTEVDSDRWLELASLLFGPKEGLLTINSEDKRRRTFRIPTKFGCTIRHGEFLGKCFIKEVGHINVSLIAPESLIFKSGEEVKLINFNTPKEEINCEIDLKVVRTSSIDDAFLVGLELGTINEPEQFDLFYKYIYYPSYMRFLEKLADDSN